MEGYGNTGINTVFYSFGARTPDACSFLDTLHLPGPIFNDALDGSYLRMLSKTAEFGLSSGVTGTRGLNKGLNRNDIFTY